MEGRRFRRAVEVIALSAFRLEQIEFNWDKQVLNLKASDKKQSH